ncbi:MAG: hypothetical protein ABIP36_08525 [Acidimicrobiales bacterium]
MPVPTTGTSPWVRRGALAALVVVLVVAGTLWWRRPERSVVLVGDSIAQETTPYLRDALGGTRLIEKYFGGTAPCDWLDNDLRATSHRVVALSFTGNSFTPCMADGQGGFLHGQALLDRYRLDLTTLVDGVASTGAAVLLVGQPARGPAAADGTDAAMEVAGINAIYKDLADADPADEVTFVDAGAQVETPDGAFAESLPCRPGEAECGPGGQNPVRNADGVHLCVSSGEDPCQGYSSGAFRFAAGIAKAVQEL